MSMTGFILGLGDRHTENILCDSLTGAAVHVDFECLFYKGMTLGIPEKVPFRLTSNIIDGLGLTGYEGTFRRVSEITMKILKENKETIISVMEMFLRDPLMEWNKKQSNSLDEAKKVIDGISDRLSGLKRTLNFGEILYPLSTEGMVESLIQDATSESNLASMYSGWASYL